MRLKLILILILLFNLFQVTSYPQEDKLKNNLANDLLLKANKLSKNYKLDSALVLYDSALYLTDVKNDQLMIANIYRLKGSIFRISGNNDSAFKYYFKARKIANALQFDSICARSDIGLSHLYEDRGFLDSSEFLLMHSLEDYNGIKDTVGIGRALYHLSDLYQTKVDYETSLKYALESSRIFKQFNDKELYCRSLLNLGNIYQAINEYDTALACYELSKQINIELNNLKRAAKLSNNKAVIHYYQGKYKEAIDELLDAIKFNEKIDDTKELSIFYRNISVLYKKINDKKKAFEFAEKALVYAQNSNNAELLSDALINLGVHHKQNNNYKLAEKYYLEGIEIAEDADLKWDMQTAYENITLLYEAMNNYKAAYEFQQKFIDITDSINNIEQIKAREKYKAEYELLHYKDQSRIKELEKKKIRFERNLSFGIGITTIVLLILFLFFFRMRARKNKIIAAQKIQKLEDEKKLMAAQSVMIGQEKERERIARELHDGIGVLLSTASIHFSTVEEKSDPATGNMLKKANKLLNEASKEVRQISHNMMPGVLSKFGLREAIEDLFEGAEDAGEFEVELEIKCQKDRLSENTEIMIYRVIQEMLNNTIKHSKATKVILSVLREDDEITINYRDNGIGFDESKLPQGKNFGLSGIKSRIDYLNGTVVLTSEPNKGTNYQIKIPLEKKAV